MNYVTLESLYRDAHREALRLHKATRGRRQITNPWTKAITTLFDRMDVQRVGTQSWWCSSTSTMHTLSIDDQQNFIHNTGEALHKLRESWRAHHYYRWAYGSRREAQTCSTTPYDPERLKQAHQLLAEDPEMLPVLTGAFVSPAALHVMDRTKSNKCPWCDTEWASFDHFATCQRLPDYILRDRPTPPTDPLAYRLGWPKNARDTKDADGTGNWARHLVRLRKAILMLKPDVHERADAVAREGGFHHTLYGRH